MQTIDINIPDPFSPAAIVAVGLADRYATVLFHVGLELGLGR